MDDATRQAGQGFVRTYGLAFREAEAKQGKKFVANLPQLRFLARSSRGGPRAERAAEEPIPQSLESQLPLAALLLKSGAKGDGA